MISLASALLPPRGAHLPRCAAWHHLGIGWILHTHIDPRRDTDPARCTKRAGHSGEHVNPHR